MRRPSPLLAQVGRERLGALGGRSAAPIVFVPQRRRETFLALAARHVARERLAATHRGQHAAFGASTLERFDLGVGPARLGRGRRAQDDQELRRG